MQRTILLFLSLLTAAVVHAQPNFMWQKSLGGAAYDDAKVVIQTYDSCYLVVGSTESVNGDVTSNHGSSDVWIAKLSPAGSILWQKTYGGTLGEYGITAQQTSDSGFIVAGYSLSADGDVDMNRGIFDAWVLRLSPTGSVVWKKTYGGSSYDVPLHIISTTDGGYIMAGWSKSNDGDVSGNHGDEDVWVVKLSDTGAIQWQKSMGGTLEDHGTCIIQTKDGGYLVSGFVRSNDGDVSGNHGGDDYWVVKLSSTGSIQWQKCYGGSSADRNGDHAYSGSLQQTLDGGFILSGWSMSTNGDVTGGHGDYDAWIVKLNDTGALTWQKALGGTGDDEANFVMQTRDSGYIFAGISDSSNGNVSTNNGGSDVWVVKLTNAGSVSWERSYGGPQADIAFCIQETKDTGYIVAGYNRGNGGQVTGSHGNYDLWVIKLKMPTVVINLAEDITRQSLKIMPNPTDGIVRVEGSGQPINIQVFNISGALLKTGLNTNTISLQELPTGIYYMNILNKNNVLLKQEKILKK